MCLCSSTVTSCSFEPAAMSQASSNYWWLGGLHRMETSGLRCCSVVELAHKARVLPWVSPTPQHWMRSKTRGKKTEFKAGLGYLVRPRHKQNAGLFLRLGGWETRQLGVGERCLLLFVHPGLRFSDCFLTFAICVRSDTLLCSVSGILDNALLLAISGNQVTLLST